MKARAQKVHLLCLPFSGGNCYSYRGFEAHLAEGIRLIAFDLPGHGRRLAEPLLRDIHAMVNDLYRQVQQYWHGPYALYGHSLGTLLGYLLACKIASQRQPMPLRLFVSGRQGPSVPEKNDNIHLLPDEQFIAKVMEYGGIPQQIAAEKELMALFVPIMKADFEALANYEHISAPLLDLPITVLFGSDDDDHLTQDETLQWQDVTQQKVIVREFPGNHFFIFDHLPEIGQLISQTLGRVN